MNIVQPTTPNTPKEYTVKTSARDSVTKKLLVITSKYEVHTSAHISTNKSKSFIGFEFIAVDVNGLM